VEDLVVTDYGYLPPTWILPQEYQQFKEALDNNKAEPNLWILKPSDRSKGVGIELISSTEQIPEFLKSCEPSSSNILPSHLPKWSQNSYVISRYVSDPLLLNKRKFDLRVYVLVLQFKPRILAYV
jgi:hypothetical protein